MEGFNQIQVWKLIFQEFFIWPDLCLHSNILLKLCIDGEWNISSVRGYLSYRHQNLSSAVTIIPALVRWRQADSWSLLDSQFSHLMGFSFGARTYLKNKLKT